MTNPAVKAGHWRYLVASRGRTTRAGSLLRPLFVIRHSSLVIISGAFMALHHLEPERATLHGRFSRELPPALTIDPGDTVVLRTLQAGWALGPRPADAPEKPGPRFEPRDPERDDGHALCGPIV